MTQQKTFGDVVHTFWSTTSIKGIPRAIKSVSLVTRIFWGLTTLGCLSVLLFQASTILIKYYQYVVVINAYNANENPHFPDVTVCAQTPYDAIAHFNPNYTVYSNHIANLRHQVANSTSSPYADADVLWEELLSLPTYISTQPSFHGTPPLPASSTFITDCNWFQWNWSPYSNGETGNICRNTMTVNWNPNYYQCYDYHPPISALMGFSSIIYVDNFITNIFNSTKMNLETSITPGIRILIHPRNTYPVVLFSGVDISPGNEFTIRLAETQVTHLGDPFGPCTRQALLDPLDPTSYVYTQDGCLTVCRQQQYIDQCGCLVPHEAFTARQMQETNNTFCSSNILSINATDPLATIQSSICEVSIYASNSLCSCSPPCAETQYDLTTSTVDWPGPANQMAFYYKYIKPFPEIYGNKFAAYEDLSMRISNMTAPKVIAELKSINLIPKNFIQLNVAFSTQDYQINADMAAVGWETLFSNLGGALNLWMGITVLFAGEVAEFLVTLVTLYFTNKHEPHEEHEEMHDNSLHSDLATAAAAVSMVVLSEEGRVVVKAQSCDDNDPDANGIQEKNNGNEEKNNGNEEKSNAIQETYCEMQNDIQEQSIKE